MTVWYERNKKNRNETPFVNDEPACFGCSFTGFTNPNTSLYKIPDLV